MKRGLSNILTLSLGLVFLILSLQTQAKPRVSWSSSGGGDEIAQSFHFVAYHAFKLLSKQPGYEKLGQALFEKTKTIGIIPYPKRIEFDGGVYNAAFCSIGDELCSHLNITPQVYCFSEGQSVKPRFCEPGETSDHSVIIVPHDYIELFNNPLALLYNIAHEYARATETGDHGYVQVTENLPYTLIQRLLNLPIDENGGTLAQFISLNYSYSSPEAIAIAKRNRFLRSNGFTVNSSRCSTEGFGIILGTGCGVSGISIGYVKTSSDLPIYYLDEDNSLNHQGNSDKDDFSYLSDDRGR